MLPCRNGKGIIRIGKNHPDILSIRPEAKSRIITIEQIRDLMQTVHLKPTCAPWKVAIIEAADRLNVQAANAFLKTLEEPPADSILILLSSDPARLLETILSRCLRLNFAGESSRNRDPEFEKRASAGGHSDRQSPASGDCDAARGRREHEPKASARGKRHALPLAIRPWAPDAGASS